MSKVLFFICQNCKLKFSAKKFPRFCPGCGTGCEIMRDYTREKKRDQQEKNEEKG